MAARCRCPTNSVTLAYSFQVMEHIHPDDALEQLRNLFAVIAPGGSYVCVTPNRLNGPHDVSKFYDPVARGFHLKEYTIAELEQLFRGVGFRAVQAYPPSSAAATCECRWACSRASSGCSACCRLASAGGSVRKPIVQNLLSPSLRAIK